MHHRKLSDLTPQEIVCALEERITPENWTIGDLARDSEDHSVSVSDPDACKFCALGHVFRYIYEQTGVCFNKMSIPIDEEEKEVLVQTLDLLDQVAFKYLTEEKKQLHFPKREFYHTGEYYGAGDDTPWVDPYFIWKLNDMLGFEAVQELNRRACELAKEKDHGNA